ncbi:M56 family metallopeptidase [Prosthecobacter vanneervenii]|uniref:Beta-lactamase regulating signal transducer with metallopeptidase domain n=1 Tax=Prosthecobacter vanneervenii TaxID=48466 RepID=A0A7W8DLX9_9BACT|nr:M56 family metallopeptidase [Prosthecobacter vanneervenii]MBB5034834.1 beta-lactamase regulating signal transducer with metallopeptidase domain [Prosthecobacter vanneervenii]
MNAETIACLNYVVHSLVIGAAAWLLVRFVIRDALRRCILANLAVLMCLYTPFNIGMEDLFPPQKPVPVWTPIRETFKADWRVSVAPAKVLAVDAAPQVRSWDVNEVVRGIRWFVWIIAAAVLMRLLYQTVRVQLWAWRLREPTQSEMSGLPTGVPYERISVFEGEGTPCVAGWFFPVIAVPASAFQTLTPREWSWLLRHEAEHLRLHDTVVALLQNIVRACQWWNPFVHALMEEYARAREEMCDAAAVGGKRETTAYADFLLAWAAKPVAQQACVMPIAYSRPARRLKARLVALMEARGVRKKAGALFVLGCLAFAVIAPMIAASFGIATAAAQEAVKAGDDGAMRTRRYTVTHGFLDAEAAHAYPFAPGETPPAPAPRKTARQLLEEKGVLFPPGASAVYDPRTSQLIVRNTPAHMEKVERAIEVLNQRLMMVHFNCKMVQADRFFGIHQSILSNADLQALMGTFSVLKGIDLLTSPNVTTRFDQNAIIEVTREVQPKVLPDGKLSGDQKYVGMHIELLAKSPVRGKAIIETTASLGIDPDANDVWLPKGMSDADWGKVRIHSVGGKAALASGETLLLHLPNSKRPVTVLITANTIDPRGGRGGSFSSTMGMAPPASQGSNVTDEKDAEKKTAELPRRVYLVPVGFGDGKKPAEYLEAKGVDFPQGANAVLADGKLTVQNTRKNLDLIEQLLLKSMTAGGDKAVSIKVDVHVAEVEDGKILGEWNPEKSTWIREPGAAPVSIRQAPPEVRHVFSAAGVMTDAQWRTLQGGIKGKAGVLLDALPGRSMKHDERAVFDMPAALGGGQLAVRPQITSSSGSLSVNLQFPDLIPAAKRLMTTQVQIWDGQTVAFSGIPSEKEKVFRVIFVTARLVYPSDDGKK